MALHKGLLLAEVLRQNIRSSDEGAMGQQAFQGTLPNYGLLDHPSKLYIEVTTRCNLNCVMCVKQTESSGLCDGDFSPHLYPSLESAFPTLRSLILNGIGEPLLNLNLESFIQRAKSLMPADGWVGFQSNGLLLSNSRALSLINAGLDRICLSIDAITPEIFSRVREGGRVEEIHNAFRALSAAKKRTGRDSVRVGIEFVAMKGNLHELPAAIEWAAQHGASFAIVTHLLPYDREHTAKIAFSTCSDQAISLFRRWEIRAKAEHLDLNAYFAYRFGRYSRTPQEQRIVDLVDAMKAEAEQLGIFLDLKKLLAICHEDSDELAETFAETEAVARRHGIELKLPAVALSEQRRCTFVENGAAFVSWHGEVSPCYFLWHRFQCYASGWRQQVQTKVFGTISCSSILDIWNSPEYVAFRKDVLAYDYPTCASCGLAPCDYVDSETFDQDCHIRNVPCGACLWCMGVFNCLE